MMQIYGGPPQPIPEDDPRNDPIIPAHTDPLLDQILRDKVLTYRCKRFLDAGFTIPQARQMTVDLGIETHFVLYRLIERGCDPDTAFDIVS